MGYREKETIKEINVKQRAKLIEAMDTIILSLNNESGIEGWLMLGPGDGSGPEEYQSLAEMIDSCDGENSCYEDACRCFIRTILNYSKDGFFTGNVLSASYNPKEYKEMLLERVDRLSKWYDIGDKKRVYTSYEIKAIYEFLTGKDSKEMPIKDIADYVENYYIDNLAKGGE